MDTSFHITEVAIFSLDTFTFGIDTKQIQEIFMVNSSAIIGEAKHIEAPFFVVSYSHTPLPVFDLRPHLCLSCEPQNTLQYPVITFQTTQILAACWVTAIEDIRPVSLRSLYPVPAILTNIARHNNIWGFYDSSDALLPLLDLEQVLSSEAIDFYVTFLSKLSMSFIVNAES